MIDYLSKLKPGKTLLWCFLLWYLGVLVLNFDPSIRIWLNSLGISLIVGFALVLSVSSSEPKKGSHHWQTIRLFMMPFCVSSFSTLIKDKGFILIFPSQLSELITLLIPCILFLIAVFSIKRLARRPD